MLVHHRELSTQHPPHIYIACVWLKALIVAQYLQRVYSRLKGWAREEGGGGVLNDSFVKVPN